MKVQRICPGAKTVVAVPQERIYDAVNVKQLSVCVQADINPLPGVVYSHASSSEAERNTNVSMLTRS